MWPFSIAMLSYQRLHFGHVLPRQNAGDLILPSGPHRAEVQYVPYIGTDLLRPGEKMERDMQAASFMGWLVAGRWADTIVIV